MASKKTLAAIGLASLLLTACDLDAITDMVREPTIQASDYGRFNVTYERVLTKVTKENPGAGMLARQAEKRYGMVMSFDLEGLDLSAAPPQLEFPSPSSRETRNLVFQNLAPRMNGSNGLNIANVYTNEVRNFIRAYAMRVDEEISRIEVELAEMEEAYGLIAPVADNLHLTKVSYRPNSVRADFINGTPRRIYGADLSLGLPQGAHELEVSFAGGLGVGERETRDLPLPEVAPEAVSDLQSLEVTAVVIAEGRKVTTAEVEQAIRLIEARKAAFLEFREGLEEKLEEALNQAL